MFIFAVPVNETQHSGTCFIGESVGFEMVLESLWQGQLIYTVYRGAWYDCPTAQLL